MIKSLQIRNYALIDELTIHFSKGLTIITGETGAGKSILLGALGLILGKRADIKSLYNLEKKCVIEADFDISAYDLHAFFQENDLDYDSHLFIRREITPSGKSRAFVNDTPVNLPILQELSATLIDLHQQFDNLDIHKVSFQLRLLDALAENKGRLLKYQKEYSQFRADQRRLSQLIERNNNASKELEFLEFQLEELIAADLQAEEQSSLESELDRHTNAEDIKRTLAGAFQQLSESELSIITQLQEINQAVGGLRKFGQQFEQLFERLNSSLLELNELSNDCEEIAEQTEYDPERIMEIQQRLDMIYRLQNKHQVSDIEGLLEIQESLRQQVDGIGDLSNEIAELEKTVRQQREKLEGQAAHLSDYRHRVVAAFENKVEKMLSQLSMEHARMKVDISRTEELGPTGYDEVNFLFSANKGGRLNLIKDVASGGELSRLTLVVKSLVAKAIPLPTLIFDEIDTGISGDVALKMGRILKELSDEHQVVSITHSPQIASKANKHYFVFKKIKDERTITNVRELEMEGRVYAIATMLSQDPPSESAISNAKELLSVV
jgi:DNA repair protein RecN (Recombination protein N)